ncbi:GNAT family N-acetyltransferase [Secundilactobacillus kimchicus]|uniref:N-acetyltransferase domain-containing protein n=1 Tax=Secundilactobacillus kimchicus JCM 15530 TaxID=1302272 RepID=A0A0R1HYA5_9LACO|nr:GNAT family N-acetyltransferase [Secundilactobacillus kimchicus]KRK48482.1 hypothetical protein FC96_GL001589 [Secundilactobacillus kimchicus JCM 15530]MBT9671228.1 GNAT family N-acetyltransferase [Secundilactobacillus kimchicus]
MTLTIKRVVGLSDANAQVKALYKRAFPKEERIPYSWLKSLAHRAIVDFLAYYDDHQFVGFTYTITHHDVSYLFFLAVNDQVRSKGYGSQILQELDHQHPLNRIILMVEPLDSTAINSHQREARLAFYTKNGFHRTGITTVEQGVTYDMLSKRGNVTAMEYRQLIKSFTGWLFPFFKPTVK